MERKQLRATKEYHGEDESHAMAKEVVWVVESILEEVRIAELAGWHIQDDGVQCVVKRFGSAGTGWADEIYGSVTIVVKMERESDDGTDA